MFDTKMRLIAVAGLGLAVWAGAKVESKAVHQPKLLARVVPVAEKTQASVRFTHGPVVEYISSRHAVIGWSTNVATPTALRFGTAKDKMTQLEKSRWRRVKHQVELSRLHPQTTYYFQVITPDATAPIGSFTTREQGIHPERYPQGRPSAAL